MIVCVCVCVCACVRTDVRLCVYVCACVSACVRTCAYMCRKGYERVLHEREDGVNMITDVLYSVSMYTHFCVKRFELSHGMAIAL